MSTDIDAPTPEPLPRESNRTRAAFEDYYAMGPGRSLTALVAGYRVRGESDPRPPARRLATVKAWSAAFGWQARIAERDAAATAAAARAFEAERQAALQSGFAVLHRRVDALNALAELLQGEVLDATKRWLADAKWIGGFESGSRVELERFNAPLIEQFRGALSDIAAELGARVKGVEVVGKGGGPVQVSVIEVIAPGLEGPGPEAAAGAAAAAAGAVGTDDA